MGRLLAAYPAGFRGMSAHGRTFVRLGDASQTPTPRGSRYVRPTRLLRWFRCKQGGQLSGNSNRRWGIVGLVVLVLFLILFVLTRPEETPPASTGTSHSVGIPVSGEQVWPDLSSADGPKIKGVDCEVITDLTGKYFTLTEHNPKDLEPLGSLAATVEDGWLQFVPRNDEGLGILRVKAYKRHIFAWINGACLEPIVLKSGPVSTLRGWVEGEPPFDDFWVIACDYGTAIEDDGTFELQIPYEGKCDVHAFRLVGVTQHIGPPVPIDLIFGSAIQVILTVPSIPGLAGWDVMETDDGFRIMAVLPHSPAEAAGLQVGDMILSIDEDPAADLRANGVDDRLPMKIEVLRDGELIPVEVKGEPPHGDKPF